MIEIDSINELQKVLNFSPDSPTTNSQIITESVEKNDVQDAGPCLSTRSNQEDSALLSSSSYVASGTLFNKEPTELSNVKNAGPIADSFLNSNTSLTSQTVSESIDKTGAQNAGACFNTDFTSIHVLN